MVGRIPKLPGGITFGEDVLGKDHVGAYSNVDSAEEVDGIESWGSSDSICCPGLSNWTNEPQDNDIQYHSKEGEDVCTMGDSPWELGSTHTSGLVDLRDPVIKNFYLNPPKDKGMYGIDDAQQQVFKNIATKIDFNKPQFSC